MTERESPFPCRVLLEWERFKLAVTESEAWWRLSHWRCFFGHEWRYEAVNVAPDVVTHMTGGFDECARCGSCRNFWGHV